ncbi:transcriptional regulator [Vibrio ichthyoenteri ATCC 700023]|uniref:Transcriptional regulator n=1 Tax=Vibrio ichthyoenteri ATCC 700023 TaxID=870968 RepID=F9S0J9_9VIBR|nr:helix-turn-helix transcriptional regulator [Vibrio ichthyoenteri]EGU43177.1 transcriptional regulator [Vibrio ichthyoenteri ATCC 700023]
MKQEQSVEYDLITACIESINSVQFSQRLMALLSDMIDFDCAVILGYRDGKRPIYLYDSIDTQRELLFQRYLTNSFLHDPFYVASAQQANDGVYRLSDVINNEQEYKDYQRAFYTQTGWKDELSIVVAIDDSRWVAIYLGYIHSERHFSVQQKSHLEQRYSLLKALCKQHWLRDELLLAHSKQTNMAQTVQQALTNFGQGCLTQREKEITMFLVQGFSTQDIADHLAITVGTVKNHRKKIYAQLKVGSLNELFQLFLNHLITHE